MRTEHTDPATISVWRWQWSIGTLIVAAIWGAVLFPREHAPWIAVMVLILMIGLIFGWFWPATYYRHLRYGVDETGIVIQRGVLWRSHIALPRVRIQHTDVSQGPLQRRYGVGTLRLYTAGSRHTMIELPGLAHGDAISLRDALLAESAASGV